MAKTPKNYRQLLKWIEIVTILIMIAIFFVGMSSNLAINKTLDAYAHKNIFTAKMKFVNRSDNMDDDDLNTLSRLILLQSADGSDTNKNPLHVLFSNIINSTNSNSNNTNNYSSDVDKNIRNKRISRKIPETTQSTNFEMISISKKNSTNNATNNDNEERKLTDDQFLELKQVDLYTIQGKKKSVQEYLVFYPLVTLIVATSWTALLICFRSGGYCNDEWVSIGPWRIVIPSIVCFAVMSISSLVYVFLSNQYSGRLCNNLASELQYPQNYTCVYLLEKLAPLKPFHVFPTSTQFKIYRVSIKIDLVLWFIALCITSVRWILAIDFELVKIALSPYYRDESKVYDSEFEEPTTIAETKLTQLDITEAEETPRKKPMSIDSRDDLDDFQSAHSHLNGNGHDSTNDQEFSSLEPLIYKLAVEQANKNDEQFQTDTV